MVMSRLGEEAGVDGRHEIARGRTARALLTARVFLEPRGWARETRVRTSDMAAEKSLVSVSSEAKPLVAFSDSSTLVTTALRPGAIATTVGVRTSGRGCDMGAGVRAQGLVTRPPSVRT